MKIKLAILEKDKSYLNRIVTAFGSRYADKFELYSFTDQEAALRTLESSRIEILLANESFDIDTSALPKRCAFAYLVESKDIDSINGEPAIGKFQKAELIQNQLINLYLDKTSKMISMNMNGDQSCVFVFASAAGGVGNSTMAAACALHFAAMGKKALYLNLERFGAADFFFHGDGQYTMHDVIYALKSRRMNLGIKLQSYIRKDPRGVSFFAQSKLALDRFELTGEEILLLINELKQGGKYDYIIVDIDFALDNDTRSVFRQGQGIVMVSDGSQQANMKTLQAFEALQILEEGKDASIVDKISLAYNRFSSKQGEMLDIKGLHLIGGARVYSGGTMEQILEQITPLDLFDRIV